MESTLLIMAAGIGSRYGGLKQIEGVGPGGEAIIEYSIYDAVKAGFDEIVFIIRKDIEEDFNDTILSRIDKDIKVSCVFQDLNDLPVGFHAPKDRIKPWGTAHAIWSARNNVRNPFLVINADDFYGRGSYLAGNNFLKNSLNTSTEYGLIGYYVANTLSKFGGVTRAVCTVDNNNYLQEIYEVEGIGKKDDSFIFQDKSRQVEEIKGSTIVSMNMWAFTPKFFSQLEIALIEFLKLQSDDLKSEFLIPTVIHNLIISNEAKVLVLPNDEKWIGMTYQEDKPQVKAMINELTKSGKYPAKLWNK